MNKIQKFPQTVGSAVNVADPTKGESSNSTELNEALENLAGGMLTDDQKAWIESQMGNVKKQKAQALFSVSDSTGTLTFYEDTTAAASMKADRTVTIKFNGSNVDPTTKGDLTTYTNSATGVYKRTDATSNPITSASPANAASFSYKVPAGTYGTGANQITVGASENIVVTGSIAQKAISVGRAAYWGWLDGNTIGSNNSEALNNAIAALTRITANKNEQVTNNKGGERYLWIATKGTASATTMGLPVDFTTAGSKSFESPQNENITLSGYTIYVSQKVVANGTAIVLKVNI